MRERGGARDRFVRVARRVGYPARAIGSPRRKTRHAEGPRGVSRGFRGHAADAPRASPPTRSSPARSSGVETRARDDSDRVRPPPFRPSPSQAVSKRVLGASNDRYAKNIHKRGLVDIRAKDKSKSFSVGPVMLGFFIFVVIGSSLLQIIRTATSGAGPENGRL
jgi:hypothetical protein